MTNLQAEAVKAHLHSCGFGAAVGVGIPGQFAVTVPNVMSGMTEIVWDYETAKIMATHFEAKVKTEDKK